MTNGPTRATPTTQPWLSSIARRARPGSHTTPRKLMLEAMQTWVTLGDGAGRTHYLVTVEKNGRLLTIAMSYNTTRGFYKTPVLRMMYTHAHPKPRSDRLELIYQIARIRLGLPSANRIAQTHPNAVRETGAWSIKPGTEPAEPLTTHEAGSIPKRR